MKDSMQRLFVGLVVLAVAVVVALFAIHAKSANSGGLIGVDTSVPEPPIEAARADALRRALAVFENAPSMSSVRFGPAVQVAAYRVRWIVGDAFVAPNGVLYVAVAQPGETSLDSHFAVATLNLGRLTLLPLPSTRAGYSSMVFVGNGAMALLQADDTARGYRLFSLTPSRAVELPYREIDARPPANYLSSGERCEQPRNLALPAVLYALPSTTNGTPRPLVTRSEFQRATGGLIEDDRLVTMFCSTFGGQDYVTVVAGGTWGVVFRLDGGALKLFSRGHVFASGPRHMLISQTEDSPQGPTGYQDYLDAAKY
jgi:hypothetical protein